MLFRDVMFPVVTLRFVDPCLCVCWVLLFARDFNGAIWFDVPPPLCLPTSSQIVLDSPRTVLRWYVVCCDVPVAVIVVLMVDARVQTLGQYDTLGVLSARCVLLGCVVVAFRLVLCVMCCVAVIGVVTVTMIFDCRCVDLNWLHCIVAHMRDCCCLCACWECFAAVLLH